LSIVEPRRPSENRRVTIESPRPQCVTQDDHRPLAGYAVLIVAKEAPERGARPENVAVVARHERADDALACSVGPQAHRPAAEIDGCDVDRLAVVVQVL